MAFYLFAGIVGWLCLISNKPISVEQPRLEDLLWLLNVIAALAGMRLTS